MLLRYFLGALLNSADCNRHFRIGDNDIPASLPLDFSPGDEGTLSQEKALSEQGEGGTSGTDTSGEKRSGTLKFCSQPRLVRLLSSIDWLSPTPCTHPFFSCFRIARRKVVLVMSCSSLLAPTVNVRNLVGLSRFKLQQVLI